MVSTGSILCEEPDRLSRFFTLVECACLRLTLGKRAGSVRISLTAGTLIEMTCVMMSQMNMMPSWNAVGGIFLVWMSAHLSLLQGGDSKSYPVLSGVGIALALEDGGIVVRKVLPGSPAFNSGFLAEGSQLVSVETLGRVTSLLGKSVGDAASLIRGPVGTEITLYVRSTLQERVVPVRLVRAPLEIAGVPDASYQSFIGKALPELPLQTFEGEAKREELKRQIVVLDFWASWCATCYDPVSRMETLVSKHPQWQGKVALVAVSIDSDPNVAKRVIQKKGWDLLEHRLLSVEAFNGIGLSVIPLVIILDQEGIVSTMSGAHAIDIEAEVNALLGY